MFSLLLFMSRVHSGGLGHQRPGSPHLRISTRATGRCVCVCRSPVILQSDPGIFLRSAFFLQSVRFGSSLSGLEFGRENRSPTSLGPSCPPDFPLAQRALPLRPSPSHEMGSGLCPRGSLCPWVFLSPVRSAPRPLPDAARKRLHASSLDEAQKQCGWSSATSVPVGAPG